MQTISKHVWEIFQLARQTSDVHDIDIAQWANEKAGELKLEGFIASDSWILRWKKMHSVVTRHITKVVTKVQLKGREKILSDAKNFVLQFHEKYSNINPGLVMNTDQCGINYNILKRRTLDIKGVKVVHGPATNINATSHSYTVQPLISADGSLAPVMLIVLQETSSAPIARHVKGFGPEVYEKEIVPLLDLFDNLHIWSSTSGMCNIQIIKDWFVNVFFKVAKSGTVLLADSYNCYKRRNEIENIVEYTFERIPEGTTGDIQPLDVYFNLQYKAFLKSFTARSSRLTEKIDIHKRNQVLRLNSLTIWVFSAPRFRNMVKYAFHKSGFLKEKPGEFMTPVHFCFPRIMEHCQIDKCKENGFIRCPFCTNYICFSHFFDLYHRSTCNK